MNMVASNIASCNGLEDELTRPALSPSAPMNQSAMSGVTTVLLDVVTEYT